MKLCQLIARISVSLVIFYVSSVQAGIPVWRFTPDSNFPPRTIVSATGTTTVKYTVTNNSSKPHDLVLKPQTGVSQNGPCNLSSKGSCVLTLTINGSELPSSGLSGGPILCQANSGFNQCYQPNKDDLLAIRVSGSPLLSISINNLALSVNDTATNAALTGNPRQIIVTNSGTGSVSGLSISYPTWPTGTTVDTSAPSACSSSSTLAAGGSCTITIVPGANATSACTTGIVPTPGIISVTANNANQVSANVVILGYGCQYQAGFIYAVDDTTPNTGSIGGRVTSLVDQAAPNINTGPQGSSIIWSSNGSGNVFGQTSNDIIPFIEDVPTVGTTYNAAQTYFNTTYFNTGTYPFPPSSAFATCSGAYDGQCDTNNILALYDTYITNYGNGYLLAPGPTTRADYAAGLCTTFTAQGYSDWYLPAVCQMGRTGGFTCAPGTQNMEENLPFLIGDPGAATPSTSCSPPAGTACLAGDYWSSTIESGVNPVLFVFLQSYNIGGFTGNSVTFKGVLRGARCSRNLI